MPGNKPTAFENLIIWVFIPILSTLNQLVQKTMALALPQANLGMGWLGDITHNPWIWAVLVCEIVTFVLWIGVLKNVNLSHATPVTAISYVMILLADWMFFGQTVHISQIIGVMAIVWGLQLLAPEPAP